MKHPKRFCVECDTIQFLTIKQGVGCDMYHCRACGAEVCRVGDGDSLHNLLTVAGGIDAKSMSEEAVSSGNLTDIALGTPDVLSNEHGMWQPRDLDAERDRFLRAAAFKRAYEGLTYRQKEVVQAVERFGTQDAAARKLGISRGALASILGQIQKKLSKSVYKVSKQGLIGRETI